LPLNLWQAAQEREELQRKGDDLDARIRKAEKEIRALENTLHLMNSRNESYRKGLTRVEQSSEEVAQLEMLEGQWRAALDKFKHKKKQVRQLEGDLQTMGRTLSSLNADEANLASKLQEEKSTLATLNKELEELKAKKDRVTKQHDIELRELKDFGTTVVQQIGTLATKQPELTSTIQLLFSQVYPTHMLHRFH